VDRTDRPAGPTRSFGDERSLLRLAFIGFAASGFTSIAYEVLWTRALTFAIGNSVYAFTTILVVFLGGFVPGAFIASRLADRLARPMRALGWIQIATAASVLALFSQAGRLPAMTVKLVEKMGAGSLFADVFTKVVPAAVALFIPAVIIGLTFPFIVRVATPSLSGWGEGSAPSTRSTPSAGSWVRWRPAS